MVLECFFLKTLNSRKYWEIQCDRAGFQVQANAPIAADNDMLIQLLRCLKPSTAEELPQVAYVLFTQ